MYILYKQFKIKFYISYDQGALYYSYMSEIKKQTVCPIRQPSDKSSAKS